MVIEGGPPYIGDHQWKKGPITVVVSVEGPPYVGGNWRRAPIQWWSVEKGSLILVVGGRRAPLFIGGQW